VAVKSSVVWDMNRVAFAVYFHRTARGHIPEDSNLHIIG
jgi:hypothetical protein